MEDSRGECHPGIEVIGNDAEKRDSQEQLILLQEDNIRLRNEVAIMQQRMKDDENAISQLLVEQEIYITKFSRQLDLAEKQIRHLQQELKSKNEMIQALEKSTVELQVALLNSQNSMRVAGECHKSNEEYDFVNSRSKALQEELLHAQEENERLKEEISTKSLDFSNLQLLFSSLRKEKECMEEELLLAQIVGEAEEELDDLKDHNRKLSNQLETLDRDQNEQIRDLQGTVVDLQDHNKTLEEELLKFSEERNALETRLRELQQENTRFQRELSDLRVVVQKQGTDEHILEPEKTLLEGQISLSKKRVQILQEKLHGSKGDTKQFTVWLQGKPEQQSTFNEGIIELEILLFHMKEAVVCFKNKTHEQVEECQELKVDLEGLPNEVIFVQAENNSLKLEISNEEELLKKLYGDNSCLHVENPTLRNEISIGVDKIKNLEKECRELINKISKMAQWKEKESLMLHHFLNDLQRDNENLRCQLQNACKQCECADTEISSSKEKLLQLQDKSIILEEQISSRDDRIKRLEDGFEKLLCENGSLRNEVSQVNGQKTKLEEDVSSLWKLKSEFEAEIKSWSSKANALEADVCSLRDDNSKLATLLETQAMDMANLRLEIANVQNEMNKLARNHQTGLEDLKSTQKIIQQLQEKLSQLEHEKINAMQELEDQMSSLEHEKTVLKSEVGSLTKEIRSQKLLTSKLEEFKEKTSEALIIGRGHIQRLVVTLMDLEQLNNNLKIEKITLEVDYQEVHKNLEECQQMLKKLQEEHSGMEDESSSHVSTVLSKNGCISKPEREILSSQEQNSAGLDDMTLWDTFSLKFREGIGHWQDEKRKLEIGLQSALSRMEDDVQNLKEAFDKLKEENMNLKTEYQSVIKNYRSVQKRIEDLQEELMTVKARSRHLAEDLGKSKEIVKLKRETTDIQEDNVRFTKNSSQAGTVTDKYQEKILVLENEKSGLENEMPPEVVKRVKLIKEYAHIYAEQEGLNDPLHAESEHVQMLKLEIRQRDFISFNVENKLMLDDKNAFKTMTAQRQHDLSQLQIENYEIQQIEEMQLKVGKLEKEIEVLREENKRQSITILEGAEEKREAIRQLCFSLEHFQHENRQLKQILSVIPCNYNQPTSS